MRARRERDRRADQADADQREAREDRLAHRAAAGFAFRKSRERGEGRLVRLVVADRHAKRVGQAVGGDAAEHEAALAQKRVGLRRALARRLGEMDEQEIADARRDPEAERRDLAAVSFGSQSSLCATARSRCARSDERRDAGRERRRRDVERPADAVQRVDDVRRPVGPADAQAGEAEDLGEGARHHDVVGAAGKLDAALIVVAADIFGIGGVEHEQRRCRQAGMQPLHLA